MTDSISLGALIAADVLADANAVFEAIGWGPGNFSVPLSPTGSGDPTDHAFNTLTDAATLAMLQDMTTGTLPPIQGTWGENGAPSESDALAAVASGKLRLFTAGPVHSETDYPDSDIPPDGGIKLALATTGLQRYPEPDY